MRKTIALFAIMLAFAAAMSPVAMANVRVLHLCCPEAARPVPQHDAMEHHCGHDMAPSSHPSLRADMSDCSRHMVSTAAPGVVNPAQRVVIGRPQTAHPVLDEFVPAFARQTGQSSQKDRAPPANGR